MSSLREELITPPKASIQILGTHITDKQVRNIDFDLWVDCTKVAGIKYIMASTSTERICHSWEDPYQKQDNPGDMLEGWLKYWLDDCAERDRTWTLHKLVSFPQADYAAMKLYIQRLAHEASYGGSIEVILHIPSLKPNDNDQGYKNAQNARIQVEWRFECPFIPTDHHWNRLVVYAMVDRKKGWMDPNAPRPFYGQSPLRRARAINSIYYEVQNADGSTSRELYWPWGCDGSPAID
ncbi:hypothetical protein ASPBRDRAFT_29420 [Aspergillus brasiliensis CBS 101740]|uniref:Uncharacterized protein n=1 Tax=Aspergillus brasiliensis (strain CBS 101740 / IMI 381727 / IBT 21946) TaxID=767769 RepID=A0A1L9UL60_ASPBC|nr:hypothetical protein ASPBRDRAFT_29420 [Aspergillus brasiliensis CBS 101740]